MNKKVFSFLTFIGIWFLGISTIYCQSPDTLWTKTFGGDSTDVGLSIQQTSDTGFILVGYTRSFGAGNSDVYLIKADQDGNELWTKTYGGGADDYGNSVQETSDGGFIIVGETWSYGTWDADVFLIKTDAAGETLWTKKYSDSTSECGYSVKQLPDSGFIIVGARFFAVDGHYDVLLIRTEMNGDTIWTKTYGGPYEDIGYSVQLTTEGGFIITGRTSSFGSGGEDVYLLKTDSVGNIIWQNAYGGVNSDFASEVQLVLNTGYILIGETNSFGASGREFYVVRVDDSGDSLWTRTYGGMQLERGYSIDQTANGGYVMTGMTESFGSYVDIWVVRINEFGDTVWTKAWGGDEIEYGHSIKQTLDTGYVICGKSNSFGAGNFDVYLVKIETDVSISEQRSNETTKDIISLKCFPNPFSERTELRLFVGNKEANNKTIELKIYGLSGKLIESSYLNATENSICTFWWDGKDYNAKEVPSGIYYAKIVVGNVILTKKITKID
jgi:hypothetical protein